MPVHAEERALRVALFSAEIDLACHRARCAECQESAAQESKAEESTSQELIAA